MQDLLGKAKDNVISLAVLIVAVGTIALFYEQARPWASVTEKNYLRELTCPAARIEAYRLSAVIQAQVKEARQDKKWQTVLELQKTQGVIKIHYEEVIRKCNFLKVR